MKLVNHLLILSNDMVILKRFCFLAAQPLPVYNCRVTS